MAASVGKWEIKADTLCKHGIQQPDPTNCILVANSTGRVQSETNLRTVEAMDEDTGGPFSYITTTLHHDACCWPESNKLLQLFGGNYHPSAIPDSKQGHLFGAPRSNCNCNCFINTTGGVPSSVIHIDILTAEGHEWHELGPMVNVALQIPEWEDTENELIHVSKDSLLEFHLK